jgi:hypothetical protein
MLYLSKDIYKFHGSKVNMKTLIISDSPRKTGVSIILVNEIIKFLDGGNNL